MLTQLNLTKINKLRDLTALILYCGLIYWLSDQQSLSVPKYFTVQDKFEHAGAYFVMALLAWRYFRYWLTQPVTLLWAALGFCSFYGATDEWHQSFVAGRNSDGFDWLADTMGASLAMWGLYRFMLKKPIADKQ